MLLNTLGVEIIDEHHEYSMYFLGFRLLVDGESIGSIPGCVEAELSYWEFDEQLRAFEPAPPPIDPADCYRYVGVCDCGEAGCGATWVRVTQKGGLVRFSDFSGRQENEPSVELTFTQANYDDVMATMRIIAKGFQLSEIARQQQQP